MRARTLGYCATGKQRFPDEIEAKIALADAAARHDAIKAKVEQRAYHCPRCRGWHLTSQTAEQYEAEKKAREERAAAAKAAWDAKHGPTPRS